MILKKISTLFVVFCVISFIFVKETAAQHKEYNHNNYDPSKIFSLYLSGTYVSSAEVQNELNSSDPIERNALTEINGGFGFGVQLDSKPSFFNLDIIYYMATDYLKLDQSNIDYQYFNGINIINYQARDKFTLIPVELGIKWLLPVGTDNFKIYIGGGAGFYFGSHERIVGNLTSETTKMKPGFSMNVLAGLDYYLAPNLAANLELKFRDAAFDIDSKYNGTTSLQNPFSIRLIVDGVRVATGIKYNF